MVRRMGLIEGGNDEEGVEEGLGAIIAVIGRE